MMLLKQVFVLAIATATGRAVVDYPSGSSSASSTRVTSDSAKGRLAPRPADRPRPDVRGSGCSNGGGADQGPRTHVMLTASRLKQSVLGEWRFGDSRRATRRTPARRWPQSGWTEPLHRHRAMGVDFSDDAALHYAEIRANLKKRGALIEANDPLIAADACARGLTLVTNNA